MVPLSLFVTFLVPMIRIEGGGNEGRLEVRLPGIMKKKHPWASICDIDFTDESAAVACEQLGFRRVGKQLQFS